MQLSRLKQAAAWCASAMAFATPAAFSQEWTDLKIGQFTPYAISYSHQPDGRFILANGGQVFIQNTFGAPESTALTNTPEHLLDPAFAIVRSATQGLVGAGGYGDPTGLYTFNPSVPTESIPATALATTQNYSATFWKHPTSTREGWLIVGQNAAGASNISFVSVDGTTVGNLTAALSSYSGGITVDALGNVYTSLATDFGGADNNKILKLTAAQVDTAVAALLAEEPAPIAKEDIQVLYTADASGSIAVDAAGRVWTGGWQIEHLQAYDPATGVSRRFAPPVLLGGGSVFSSLTFSSGSFTKDGVDYVSFLAYDGSGFPGSDVVLGHAPVSDLIVRSAQVALSQASTAEEDEDTVTVTVSLTPAATAEITVPVTLGGTAAGGSDYTTTVPASVVFAPGETTKTYSIAVINDAIKGELSETVIVTLGNPAPAAEAGLGAVGSNRATLTIVDDDIMPVVAFTSASQTVTETAGAVDVTVSITPTVTEQVTVPLTVTGTATSGEDFTVPASLVIEPGDTTKTFTIQVIDDSTANEANETVIIALGAPTPVGQAVVNTSHSQFVLTILDNESKAIVSPEQNFGTIRVGTAFSVPVATEGGIATKWSAKGLPPGLKMNADGTISGTATKAGEYDQVVITTTNQYGVSTSVALLMVVEPFPAGAVGTYSGLIGRTGTATEGLGARVTLTTTNKGTYSGKVVIGKKSHSIKGNLNAATLNPEGTANVGTQALSFAINSTTGELTGSLPGGAALQGWLAQKSTDRTGIYNFLAAQKGVIPATVPQGASFGTLKLSTKAVANVSGKLADGSKFTSSSPLGVNGEVVIYQSLYKVQGTFTGAIALADNITHTISGDLTWSRPAQTSGALYASGWATPLALVAEGGKYRPTAGATLPLDAQPVTGDNAELTLQDGGIEVIGSNTNPQSFGVQIGAKKVTIAAPHKLKVTAKTGAFSGTVTLGEGSTRRVIPFQGVLVPDTTTENPFDSEGFGFFILQSSEPTVSRSGAVFLERL